MEGAVLEHHPGGRDAATGNAKVDRGLLRPGPSRLGEVAWKIFQVSLVTVPAEPNRCHTAPSNTGQGSFTSSNPSG